jgi:23S rRNA (cytidine1920-2'-O)/16S rRNA (cytidine1409-2'-O)-methyltransferase
MAALKRRLDAALAEEGFFGSVDEARRAVMAALVYVNGHKVTKPGTPVSGDDVLSLVEREKYVGRGGLKLEAALDFFRVDPCGLVCVDVGASTGGFTDCLLQRGAARVYAIDAGHGQLDWKLRGDLRVDSREKTNARFLQAADFDPRPRMAVGDVSFISLTLILPAVFGILPAGADVVFLLKPQFEAARRDVGAGGVVRDEGVRERCVAKVREFVLAAGQEWLGSMSSPITGRDGNVEYLIHLRRV